MTFEFTLRLFIAALLGGAIGIEREYRAKEAGFRTHFLVALGSALFMILSEYGFDAILMEKPDASFDPSRIAAQVVTGIGFIGAGTIIFQKNMVRGLTTAAGLWVTSAIGMTAGGGLYALSATATLLVLICLEAMNFIINRLGARSVDITFIAKDQDTISQVLERLHKKGVLVESYEMRQHHNGTSTSYIVSMETKVKRNRYRSQILELMDDLHGVVIDSIE